MQRVTNCILMDDERILLLKKPRRGWYAFPGGKMEQGETIKEAAVREFQEETALQLIEPELAGVFTFNLLENDGQMTEWMMFTFVSHSYRGKLTEYCAEGELEWIPFQEVEKLPMAEGDRMILKHVLSSRQMLMGSFIYTDGYEKLVECRLDPQPS